MTSILVVDDDKSIRESLETILLYEDYDVTQASNGKEALSILDKCVKNNTEKQKKPVFDLALLDIKMPGMDGLELLEKIKKSFPQIDIIMISGHAEIQTAVEATKKGAYDFLAKPLDQDRILITISNAIKNRELSSQCQELKKIVYHDRQLLGESLAIKQILETIERVAPIDTRVLITGENGTGKELVARAIHEKSRRNNAPFIELNCAAIPENLIESELFGHEKGAFTSAHEKRKGKFEQAHKGTLFLDEIGDMSLTAQAKVLRVLEECKVTRVGGATSMDIDVRVLAATNKTLEKESAEGNFREDLFYRLNVVPIHVPPLRERLEDIPILVSHFLVYFAHKYSIPIKKLSSDALQELKMHSWNGNIRELKNFVERLVILSTGDSIGADEIKSHLSSPHSKIEGFFGTYQTFEEFKRESEKMFFIQKLTETNWNVKKTSEILKMQRSNLYKKMEKYGLNKPEKDSDEDN